MSQRIKFIINNMKTRNFLPLMAAVVAIGSLSLAMAASAAPSPMGQFNRGQFKGGAIRAGQGAGVFGTVSAISGNTLSVAGRAGFNQTSTALTYTVDASNATVIKNGATSTVAAIAVGDTLMARGTVSGTNVTATLIRDGQFGRGGMPGTPANANETNTQTPPIQGNGQPLVVGKIVTISGTTLTITNNSNVTYTVDASSAKFSQGRNIIAVTNLNVGDSIIVQGTVNGNSVTASSVIDQARPAISTGTPGSNSETASAPNANIPQARHGFFGSIGNFFKRIFGF